MKTKLVLFSVVGLLGVLSALEARLAVFSLLLLVIALAALSRFSHPKKHLVLGALVVGLLCTSFGLYRFILEEAMPGIIEARGRESSGKAVSFLREILFAQDAMRRYAPIDPDRDLVGSAGFLGELAGITSQRVQTAMTTPPLAPRFAPRVGTTTGPALDVSGYLYIVCLPRAGGGWTASPSQAVAEEEAERRWVAYAWPSQEDLPQQTAYFIDEHETILQTDNRGEPGLRLVGREKSPACDDAWVSPGRETYTPWRDKKPREGLPGDRSSLPER